MKLQRTAVPKNFDSQWVTNFSAWPWVKIRESAAPIDFMLQEAIALRDKFEPYVDQKSEGWSVFYLGGPAQLWDVDVIDYGSPIAKFNPDLPSGSVFRTFIEQCADVKFTAAQILCLEPEGYVTWHCDKTMRRMDRMVIPLNNPQGAVVEFENWGEVPYQSGGLYLIDTSWAHRAFNRSDTARYHLQLAFQFGTLSESIKSDIVKAAAAIGNSKISE